MDHGLHPRICGIQPRLTRLSEAEVFAKEFTTYLGQLDARETPLVHTIYLELVRGRGIPSST